MLSMARRSAPGGRKLCKWVKPAIPHTGLELRERGRGAKREILQRLPIDTLLPEIVQCIEVGTISIGRADPGAGKTTRLPPALLKRGERKVFVLAPRRL